MDKDSYFIVCAKLYFLNLKETEKVSIDKFKNWKNNELFADFFLKLNKNIIFFGKKISPTYKQKKRLYSLFKKVVSTSSKIYKNLWTNRNCVFCQINSFSLRIVCKKCKKSEKMSTLTFPKKKKYKNLIRFSEKQKLI